MTLESRGNRLGLQHQYRDREQTKQRRLVVREPAIGRERFHTIPVSTADSHQVKLTREYEYSDAGDHSINNRRRYGAEPLPNTQSARDHLEQTRDR